MVLPSAYYQFIFAAVYCSTEQLYAKKKKKRIPGEKKRMLTKMCFRYPSPASLGTIARLLIHTTGLALHPGNMGTYSPRKHWTQFTSPVEACICWMTMINGQVIVKLTNIR